MKKITVTVVLLFLVFFYGFSVPNDVIYSEGDATVKYQEGFVEDVYIGDVYDTGDTVTTGYDGFVELDQEGLVLKINPDTVFTLQEKEEKGEKTGVFSLALGSIKFRYNRITGKEPMIQTPSCIAGVRGTEFSVYAGADGSALIVVDSGQVEVESEGKAVQLAAEEGVEVKPGEPPGDKFVVKMDEIEYKTWNDEKINSMLSDPTGAVENILKRLNFYVVRASEYYDLYNELTETLNIERQKMAEVLQKEGEEAAKRYDAEVVTEIRNNTRASFLNNRYYALAALALRRYVAGRLYVMVKAQFITKASDSNYRQFLDSYSEILDIFETSIIPYLVEADI
jgi:hypothetical protein